MRRGSRSPSSGQTPSAPAHRSSKRGAARSPWARRFRFERSLREHENERHGHIVSVTPSSSGPSPFRSRLPVGWRAEDVLGLAFSHGFLPLAEAAQGMNVEEDECVEMVRAGRLEANGNLVRPAVVSLASRQACARSPVVAGCPAVISRACVRCRSCLVPARSGGLILLASSRL